MSDIPVLDFTYDKLENFDTVELPIKMNSYMAKMEAFSIALNEFGFSTGESATLSADDDRWINISGNKTFTVAEMRTNHSKYQVNLDEGDVVHELPDALPVGHQVSYSFKSLLAVPTTTHSLRSGDGSVFPIYNYQDEVDLTDGILNSTFSGTMTLRKLADRWEQFRIIHYPVVSTETTPVTSTVLAVTGSVDDTSAYALGINVNAATNGTAPYTNYLVTVDFLHPNQAGRQETFSGSDLSLAPTANSFLAAAVSGTLGSLVIDSELADLYGDIDVTIAVTDSSPNTTTVTL